MGSSDPVQSRSRHTALGVALVITAIAAGYYIHRSVLVGQTEAQVARVAENLDRQTTSTGAYDRSAADQVNEQDPWGTPLQVVYSQGGLAETVVVRSAGPDGEFHTRDDITKLGISANFHGVGEGIKQNAEETASNAARGVVRGTVDGVKQSVKEAFSKQKPSSADKEEADPPGSKPANVDEASASRATRS